MLRRRQKRWERIARGVDDEKSDDRSLKNFFIEEGKTRDLTMQIETVTRTEVESLDIAKREHVIARHRVAVAATRIVEALEEHHEITPDALTELIADCHLPLPTVERLQKLVDVYNALTQKHDREELELQRRLGITPGEDGNIDYDQYAVAMFKARSNNREPKGEIRLESRGAFFVMYFSDEDDYYRMRQGNLSKKSGGTYHRDMQINTAARFGQRPDMEWEPAKTDYAGIKILTINGAKDSRYAGYIYDHELQHHLNQALLDDFNVIEDEKRPFFQTAERRRMDRIRDIKDEAIATLRGGQFDLARKLHPEHELYGHFFQFEDEADNQKMVDIAKAVTDAFPQNIRYYLGLRNRHAHITYQLIDIPFEQWPDWIGAIAEVYIEEATLISNWDFIDTATYGYHHRLYDEDHAHHVVTYTEANRYYRSERKRIVADYSKKPDIDLEHLQADMKACDDAYIAARTAYEKAVRGVPYVELRGTQNEEEDIEVYKRILDAVSDMPKQIVDLLFWIDWYGTYPDRKWVQNKISEIVNSSLADIGRDQIFVEAFISGENAGLTFREKIDGEDGSITIKTVCSVILDLSTQIVYENLEDIPGIDEIGFEKNPPPTFDD